jgi:hypothetical protein
VHEVLITAGVFYAFVIQRFEKMKPETAVLDLAPKSLQVRFQNAKPPQESALGLFVAFRGK